ncbi:MAG: ABC transporter substrate-binding protein [Syntrophobacteraceae bacterium]|nr:ABC transporter substrate-binding protein [Syntrophobacteraceae bacterium]
MPKTIEHTVGQLTWLGPFLCIGFVILALIRPSPKFPIPNHYRRVVDASGAPVRVALPFRGAALTWGISAPEYIEDTRAPGVLIHGGGAAARKWFARQVISWIYPKVLKDDKVWDPKPTAYAHGPYAEVEKLMAFNPGAYLGIGGGPATLLKRAGLPALCVRCGRGKNWDDEIFATARVMTALLGDPQQGERLIADYLQTFKDLENELRPSTIPEWPGVLIMGSMTRNRNHLYVKSVLNSYRIYLPPAAVRNASKGWTGERQDAERILAMDPDYIFLVGVKEPPFATQGPKEFMKDPRWRGLKAVREKRVYRMPGSGPGGLAGLIFQPMWVRWMAEIVHPDRLQPKVRKMLRDRLLHQFGYHITDDRIDAQLHLDENRDSAGYKRFTRDYRPVEKKEPAK